MQGIRWVLWGAAWGLAFQEANGGTSVSQESGHDEVERWVAALESDRRVERVAAREALLAMGREIAPVLDAMAPPTGFEARRTFEYVRTHLPPTVSTIDIAGGEVTVGSDNPIDRNPRRTIVVDAFRIDTTEVTNVEFARFVRETGAEPPSHFRFGDVPYGRESEPVVGVDFAAAQAYARWVRGRLPSTDEWELAAHGGRGTVYPWGDEPPERLANCAGRPIPVASEPKDVSPGGAYDFAASVAEWVIEPGGRPAARGGTFSSRLGFLRVTRAAAIEIPIARRSTLGFRVVDRNEQ